MKLVYSPNDRLQHEVKDFDFDKLDAKEIEANMIDIMLANEGIGLAANQVALDAKIFVMRPINDSKDPHAVINPVIKEVSLELEESIEGCLSFPGIMLPIKRPKELVAEFVDITGKKCIINYSGIDARCFLHEYDHLLGIEFTDRISKLKKDIWFKKSKKMQKRINNG